MTKKKEGLIMKKRLVLSIFLIFAFGFALVLPAAMAADKTIELRFAQPFSPKHTMQVRVFEPWAEKINKLTNGKVKVAFFPGGALGKTPDPYDLAEKGIADIIYILHDYTPGRVPITTVFSLPFMTPSATKASSAMWKCYEEFPAFREEYRKVKVLALFCHPGGDFHTVKKPIRTTDDLKGMKIRTANPFVTKALKSFGAIPVTTPVTETYTALERGVVDGTVVPWEGLGIFKLDELTRYATKVDFYTMIMMVVMNKKRWDSLPDDVKKVIDETSGMKLSMECGRVYDETDEPFRQRALKKGVQEIELPPSEMKKLEDLTMPLREEWIKDMDARGLPGKAVLEGALKYLKE
jgi:TRAP-type C4-dicarboxylate transport system substrate-binding protein